MSLPVVYSDDALVVVNKPTLLLSVPGRGPDKQDSVVTRLACDYPWIREVHRLDWETSGLMLLARTQEDHRELSRQFREREVQKRYLQRGQVVDENALTRALRAGDIAGAGLDVYEHGTDINPRLRELPNVVLLPHMGSATREARLEMGEKVLINVKTFADGHRPPDLVVPAML